MKITTEEFVRKAKIKHGDKYDYGKVVYKGCKIPVIITCLEHGDFWQTPSHHLHGSGCVECANKYRFKTNKRYSNEDFIKLARDVHGDKYDYKKVIYKNAKTPVIITCLIHGNFWQTPNAHLSGCGCTKCAMKHLSDIYRYSNEHFIKLAKDIHGDKYDYSKVKYKNYILPVTIGCKQHGYFEQLPGNHLQGHGCPKCGIEKILSITRLGVEKFIIRAKKVHGNKYDYSKVVYFNKDILVIIGCLLHGDFKQSPHNHCNNKAGCPKCKESKGEIAIRKYLKENNIEFLSQYTFFTCKNKKLLPFDFAVFQKEKIFVIEFNGQQHYQPTGFGGDGKIKLKRTLFNDNIKQKWCIENNVPLLIISYKDYDKINILIEEFLNINILP